MLALSKTWTTKQ